MCDNIKRNKLRSKDILSKVGVVSIEEKMQGNCLPWFSQSADVNLYKLTRAKEWPGKILMEVFWKIMDAKGLNGVILPIGMSG